MKENYSILVNTCDKFDDCWNPFFQLFKKYWPDYDGKLYLNTEYKSFSYDGLNIIPVKGAAIKQDAHLITWSECLIRALNTIDSEIVLYMQEDYFLKDNVKNDLVEKYVTLMVNDQSIDCIQLTDQAAHGTENSPYEGLLTIPQVHHDRISCQASLWRKSTLLKYVKSYETAWNFEWYGSKRAGIFKDKFYSVDHKWVVLDKFEIIPYVFTGVIGGRWYEKVVPLFEAHGIHMDYAKRGFFKERKKTFLERIKAKIKRLPMDVRSSINLLKLRMSS